MCNPVNISRILKKVYLDCIAVTDCLIKEIYRHFCERGAVDLFTYIVKTSQREKVDIFIP
ncbi:hypothetical protein [cyanobacterium endosymbiont of Epithemia clementina EcSB]|uniref:hypothetical protein n=1 Tax=cyanobacterium endosymbiont of Epithemia clementina EcSB TaxID=3034674 RepID=UPI002480DDC8|nr:hypothetical protein [cyanobacterium endosymbiont of Epithemia clementina EcSB]WGT67384.1 hypothetical protein P3F56_09325 [cyanobacterium endosymbiont of Epithemia clementina EcSB]